MITTAFEVPLTFSQERMWLLHQIDPASTAYNVCVALHLRGPLVVAELQAALHALVDRHEALRTVYSSSHGRPVATVLPTIPVEIRPLSLAADSLDAVRALAAAEAARPFDLARGPLLRAGLVRLADEEHVLILAVHHIVFDEWSMGVLFTELDLLYQAGPAGRTAGLPPLARAYADVVAAERRADLAPAAEHWRRALADLPALNLPTDHPPTAEPSTAGATISFEVPPGLTAKLTAIAREARATLYMTGLAAFSALLSRYCGQDDVAVGTTVANRSAPQTAGLIGAFFNTLVMRSDLSGDPTFTELLGRTRAFCLDALTHQHLPYQRLVEELGGGSTPLFRVMYEAHAGLPPALTLGDLTAEPLRFEDTEAKEDLSLSLTADGDRVVGHLSYRTDLFEQDTAEQLAESFTHLLGQVAEAPDVPLGTLDILPPARRELVLAAGWGAAPLGPLDRCAHTLFEDRVRLDPEATAVLEGESTLTYTELDRRSNRIAHWLQRQGVGPEDVVGVGLERSGWLVATFLGVWKAGAAYLPLDPGLPRARLDHMLTDSGARLVIDDARALERATSSLPEEPPEVAVLPDNLAYVIYTSGSTGRPKGVMVGHRGLVNFLHWCVAAYSVGGDGGAPLFSSVAYDMVVPNLYTPSSPDRPCTSSPRTRRWTSSAAP
ncbi:non-ribosomal peptide synthetase [Nonomuraea recticatena]|uniref:non-ribosomal peptide synthetase n=1 Tax=Nonomuraea recticatena TaxID=46178 RepID=UPI00362143AC